MKRAILCAVLALLIAAPSSAHHPHTVVKDYVGSYDPLSPRVCERNAQLGVNVGGACFAIPHAASSRVTVTIRDNANSTASFFYRFYDAAGRCARPGVDVGSCDSAGTGCPVAANLGIPPNAVGIEVLPSGVVLGPLTCVLGGETGAGAASFGTIQAVFRS